MAPRGKPPQNRNTRRTQTRKPATIDLKAEEVSKPQAENAKKATPGAAKSTSVPKAGTSKPAAASAPAAKPAEKPAATKAAPAKPAAKTNDAKSASAKPTSATPASATSTNTPPQKSSPGFLKLVAAAIIGAIISFFGVGALLKYDAVPPQMLNVLNIGGDQTPEKFAQLQQQIDALKSATGQTTAPVSEAVDLAPLLSRLEALENAPTPENQPATAKINELQSKIDTVAGKIENIASNGAEAIASTQIDALQSRISILETDIKAIEPIDLSPLDATKAEVANSLNARAKLSARLDDLEKNISDLSGQLSEKVTGRLDQFENKLETAATGEKLAKTVTINALKSAIQRGEPFAPSLDALEIITGSSPALDGLKNYGQKGIPTNKALIKEFHGLHRTIIAAASQDPKADTVTQLMASVRSLVAVRPSGAIAGSTTQAILSRIDANLKVENFDAAISEWKNLSEPARAASKDWIAKLESRMDADRQIHKLLTQIQEAG